MIARTMAVLGMPVSDFVHVEFIFEEKKFEFLKAKYNFCEKEEDPDKVVRSIMHSIFGDDFDKLSDWDAEVVYEMIPTYFFRFNGQLSHRENAKAFFDGKDSAEEKLF